MRYQGKNLKELKKKIMICFLSLEQSLNKFNDIEPFS